MAKIWKSEEFVWKREGFIKKSEEFLWKNDEFVWKSERIYMAQRYSKYRFFDVNCILSILFQVQLWGCPGKPKFQFHILCGRGRLYIYIYTCMYRYAYMMNEHTPTYTNHLLLAAMLRSLIFGPPHASQRS